MKLHGLSFSWKRVIGITQAKQELVRKTGYRLQKPVWSERLGLQF